MSNISVIILVFRVGERRLKAVKQAVSTLSNVYYACPCVYTAHNVHTCCLSPLLAFCPFVFSAFLEQAAASGWFHLSMYHSITGVMVLLLQIS